MELSDRDRRDADNMVKRANVVGRVVQVRHDDTGLFAKVQHNDRDNIISGWLSVGQIGAGGMRSAWLPKIGQLAKVSYMGNSYEHGTLDAVHYTPTNPPPSLANDGQVVLQFDDGGFISIDPAGGSMEIDFKGPLHLTTEGPITLDPQGPVTIVSAAQILIEASNINLKGNTEIEGNLMVIGNVENTGNMLTGGIHVDDNGVHV
jgi:phage baseplate assembly protein V